MAKTLEDHARRLVRIYDGIDYALQDDDIASIDYLEERAVDVKAYAIAQGHTEDDLERAITIIILGGDTKWI